MNFSSNDTQLLRETPPAPYLNTSRLMMLALIGVMLLCASASAADWSPSDFTGHTRANIHGAATTLTDYPVKFVLYNATGTDSSENIHLPGIAQPTFNDVRFALGDGTSLTYWMETPVGTDNATFWVKMPSIPAGYANTVPIDIYYGNATIGSAANGDATFALFDDFNGSSLDTTKWSRVSGTGTYTVSNSQLALKGRNGIQSNTYFRNNASLRFYGNLYGHNQAAGFQSESNSGNYTVVSVISSHAITLKTYVNGVTQYFDETSKTSSIGSLPDQYLTTELLWNSTQTTLTVGTNPPSTGSMNFTQATLPAYLYSSTSSGRTGYYDWVFVRQLADTEPAVNEPADVPTTIDLTVSAIPTSSSSPAPDLFAHYPANSISATVKNQGTGGIGSFNVSFNVDGNVTRVRVTELGAGNSIVVSVTDSVDRTVGASVPVTVTADAESAVAESNEGNNAYSYTASVIRNGYTGHRWSDDPDITTNRTYAIHGDTIYSLGNSVYGSDTTTWTAANLPIPAGATVKDVRLYVPYTWDHTGNMLGTTTMTFNGVTVPHEVHYREQKGWGSYSDYAYGVFIFNVTSQFNANGNSAAFTHAYAPVRGMNLVVTYEDANATEKQIFISEGFDMLFASSNYYTTEETATAYAPFTGASIDMSRVKAAQVITSVTAGSAKGIMLFNGTSWPQYWTTGAGEVKVNTTDVTPYLTADNNMVLMRSANEGWGMEPYLAILNVEYQGTAVSVPVAAFSGTPTSGTAPFTAIFTDTSTNSPTSWLWDFSDSSSVNATVQNPVHTYASAGTYTVSLTATNTAGSNSLVKSGYITVSAGSGGSTDPIPTFTATPTSGTFPLIVQFTDQTAGSITAWSWDFGDYSTPSTLQSPAHTYTNAGTYNVTLTATGTGGTNTTIQTNFVTVSPVTGTTLPLTNAKNGTVSGDLYVGAFQPVAFASQPGANTVTSRNLDQQFALPAYTNIQWAHVYVNVYSGSGSQNMPARTTTSLDGNGDGTYETVLGVENMSMSTYSKDGRVYWLNDHTNRVYSDYETEYDVTSLITSRNPAVHVRIEKTGTQFDGRLKAVTLVVAYNDGDADQVKYWVNHGGDWINSGSSSTTFGTAGIPSGFTDATLHNVALSSKDGSYTFNGVTQPNADPVSPINYFENHTWSVTSAVNPATDNVFQYTLGSDSFKTTLATLAVKYPGATAPVASFTSASTAGTAPFTVVFTDTSTNSPTSWLWDFGDSDATNATVQNPVHTYASAGTYTVDLTATNAAGSNSQKSTNFITVNTGSVAPVAAFNTTVTNGIAPVSATFNDTSANSPTSWKWEFRLADNGAWTQFSTEQNTSYRFAAAGTYDIRLTATNAAGSNTLTKTHVLAAGTAHDYLATVSSGTVSGDLYVKSVSPWTTSNTTIFTLPARSVNNITWARLYVTTYSGNANSSYGATSVVTLDGTVLGTETLNVASQTNGTAYPVNDHVMKVYSDYEAVYDVKDRISSASPVVTVTDTAIAGYLFDGRIKGITLVVAYNDGDSDVVKYVVNHGNDWMGPAGTSSSTTFDTSSIASGWTSANLKNVAFSSSDATYKFPDSSSSITKTSLGSSSYWKYNSFDVTNNLIAGSSSNLGFTAVGSSFKTTLAALTVKYPTAPSAPIAGFSGTPASGTAPLTVTFTDTSTNSPTSWIWDFGDNDSTNATVQNPVHAYASAGTYTVNLTATNAGGSNSLEKSGFITVSAAPVPPTLTSITPSSGTNAGTVTISDLKGANFASGAIVDLVREGQPIINATNVVVQSPTRITCTFNLTGAAPGLWEVDVTNPGSFTEGKSLFTVTAATGAPVAAFSASSTSGAAPLTVPFTDASTNSPASWTWDFGDNDSTNATVQNPVHTYAAAGTYTVNLTATNAGGSNSLVKFGYITVTSTVTAPVAAFSANKTVGDKPLAVKFTDASTNSPASWTWDFGDSGSSTEQNPVHTFANNGTYTVKLTAANTAGSNQVTRTGYISVIAPVVETNTFTIPGVQTTTAGSVQNVSIITGANVTQTGNVVNMTNVGSGWNHMEITLDNTPETSGSAINGTVETVRAVTEPVTAPIPVVGNPTVQIALNMSGMPGTTATITQTITKDPDATAQTSFSLFASSAGKQIDEIAYTLNVQKTNLANAGDGGIIQSATLTMTVSKTWVDAHGGTSALAILRHPESGADQILIPTISGPDASGNYILIIISPNGLSTFSVASVSAVSSGSSSAGSSVLDGGSDGPTVVIKAAGRASSSAVTSSGALAGQTTTFTVSQPVSASAPAGIRSVSIVPSKTLGSTDLIVEDYPLGNLASTLGRPVAGVEKIVPVGVSPSAIDHATISFAVSSSWLTANKIAPADVVLVHNTNGQWIDLPTTFESQSGDSYYYTATTPGFSLFAISVKSTPAASVTAAATIVPTTAAPMAESTSGLQAAAVTTKATIAKPVAAQTTIAPPAPVPEPSAGFPIPTLIVAVAGIVVLIMAVVIGKRWWVRRQNPALFKEYK
ncbi:DUF2341 domain-containing protein [Methanoregula sp.]|uniref:DUF2341 domain-containing protein n=1 Tax=Methanoregula sp. TaxID=2052170 RepID=UPI003561AA94